MEVRGLVCSALVLAFMFAAGSVVAADLPPIPDKSEVEQFKDVPAPWREYLIKARAAQRIADPLQRCVAFPDIPGNTWPTGHSRAHCESHARISLPRAELDRMLDERLYTEAEQRLDALLAQHFLKDGFSEEIDFVFDGFAAGNAVTDARTAAWLVARPASAYAHLGRGVHLVEAGIDARGGNYASKTPQAQLDRMHALIGEGIPELEAAVRIEPRLMPAHGWLIRAAMYVSRGALERK